MEGRSIEVEKIGPHWSGMTLYKFKKLHGFLLSELQQQAYYDVLPFLRHRFKDSSNSEKA
ncbi:hypothetical protein [Comamonas sp. 23]|uniref:hypothetical protein n=1 Tax=Comamonas sp. 23 TaxID=3415008 RepID=UPI003C6ED3C6